MTLRFTVYGPPAAQGSKSIGRSGTGIPYLRESSKMVAPFRRACAAAAVAAGARLMVGPVFLSIVVHAVRPKSHLLKSGEVSAVAPERPGGHDASKVGRAVEDALAGICYRNDRQVRTLFVDFHYGPGPERVEITVRPCAASPRPRSPDPQDDD